MNLTIINGILMMCLDGWFVCDRNYEQPAIKYYEPGKSCYIEGVFYTSCPKQEYK